MNLLNGEAQRNGAEENGALSHRPFSCKGVRALVVDDEENSVKPSCLNISLAPLIVFAVNATIGSSL